MIIVLASGAIYGISTQYGPWSIGIYEGPTPFNLANPVDITNPVIGGKDVIGMDGRFVADPFILEKRGKLFMFFEVMNRETNQGDIGYAESSDGTHWKYGKIVIDEPFHLSYPYVFEWNKEVYLIPESHQNLAVRVYKAASFPEGWKYVGNIIEGQPFVDPTLFRYNDTWWLFVSFPQNDTLHLYYSDDLLKGWKPHPMNPIVKSDKHFARPAGKVIHYDGTFYRFAQDDHPKYGTQVFAFEIELLSKTAYVEKLASDKPIVKGLGVGWNAAGMHHVDMHKIKDKWIAAVDGRSR